MYKRRFENCRSWRYVAAALLLSIGGPMPVAYAYTTVVGFSNGLVCGPRYDGTQAGEFEYDSSIAQSCSSDPELDPYSSQAVSFAAYAKPGKLGVSASYTISGRKDPGANTYTGLTQVSAGVYETLTIVSGPESGSIVFDIAVSGFTSASTVSRDIQFSGDARAAINGSLQNDSRGSQYTEPTITLGENEGANNRVSIRVMYERGLAPFNLFLSASAGCSNIVGNEGYSCIANADAFNSATVMGGQVFDQNGVLVEGAVVMSESGFDYLAGYPESETDSDEDGIDDAADNCPATHNPLQEDYDEDGDGDACDDDDDGDNVLDIDDAFPLDQEESVDTDGDEIGNNADTDDDGDTQLDADEIACGSNPLDADSLSSDADGDTVPDCVDSDDDNDGVLDTVDQCADTVSGEFDTPPEDWRKNRYWNNDAGEFIDPNGRESGYTLSDMSGCSASQIIDGAGLGAGHSRFGVTKSALTDWVTSL